MNVSDANLAALLLTNRIVELGEKPLSAAEFWALCSVVSDPSLLLGMPSADIAEKAGLTLAEAQRYAALLAGGTAFAFEPERLEEEGVRLISALDDAFPQRVRRRLGANCPAFLLIAGPMELLSMPAIGVVGSRDASEAAMSVASNAARVAVSGGRAVVSGLARGIDQAAIRAASEVGGAVVGVPAEGLRVAARNADVRSRVHAGELCMASPYAPSARFTAGNAMGRNRIVYALAEVTLVVCSDVGSGGTWEGAKEAHRRHFGHVAVWHGDGEGPGNATLVGFGMMPVSDVRSLLDPVDVLADAPNSEQQVLFGD